MAQNFSPIPKTTDEIGKLLKEKYSPPTDQNEHIDYFYLRVSEKKVSIAETFIPDLKTKLGNDFCAMVDPKWPGFIIICIPKQTNEEEREKAIDKYLRSPISRNTDTEVTVHRACLYPSYEMSQKTIKTVQAIDIGDVMEQTNAQQQDAKNTHQNFFYLMIKHPQILNVPSFFRTLPGNWMKVEPQDDWPDTFLGDFPKAHVDKTEREREARLNREVRLPLMKMLEDEVMTAYPKTGDRVERKVQVLITRALTDKNANTGIKYHGF